MTLPHDRSSAASTTYTLDSLTTPWAGSSPTRRRLRSSSDRRVRHAHHRVPHPQLSVDTSLECMSVPESLRFDSASVAALWG